MKINTKLRFSTLIVTISMIILALVTYISLTNLHLEFDKANLLSKKSTTMKSIMVGGLLFNSATNVFVNDPTQTKALQSMENGIEKIKSFSKELNPSPELEKTIQQFLDSTQEKLLLAKTQGKLTLKDSHEILPIWRELKFLLEDELKVIKIEAENINNQFIEHFDQLIIILLLLIILFIIIIITINMLISKGIVNALEVLKSSMNQLLHTNSTDIKIDIKSKDETQEIATIFNQYMEKLNTSIKQDYIVIDEVRNVILAVNSGLFNSRITKKASSKEIQDLVDNINNMIDATENNLLILSTALINLSNAQYNIPVPKSEGTGGLIASLLSGVKITQSTISDIMAIIDDANKNLTHSANDLANVSNHLSEASNTQASALEETAAAIEEVTSTITQSSQNASQMSTYAKEVTKSSEQGMKLANKTSLSMDEISAQVQAINEAITIIDQIAFQTNILSLNAAVEAATAGEAGKGFAVVAGEVRNLASRSAEATQEIKELVQIANTKANEGKEVSSQMIDGYTKLQENITNTMKLINAVASSSKEQENAMSQINNTVNDLDKSTQQNAASANSIARMAQETQQLCQNLQMVVDRTDFMENSKKRVCDIDMLFSLNTLKANHIEFKNDSLSKCKSGQSFSVTKPHQCQLGHWIEKQQQTNKELTSYKEWEELCLAHDRVHSMVQDTVDLYANSYANEQITTVASSVEDNVNLVFEKLDKIREINCSLKANKKG